MKGTPKQQIALKYLADKKTKEVIYGGAAGGGKSFLGCFWLLVAAQSHPGTRWFIGRQELKRIRQSTVITWYKVCRELGFDDFNINNQDNFIQLGNGSRIDLLDLRYLPSDPLYERFGSLEYTGGWIEEGGEVNFGAYDVLKTRIGRHLNAEYDLKPKLLVTCNPKKNWLYSIYKRFKDGTLKPHEIFIQAFVQDNRYITQDYIDNLRNLQDKAKKERLLFGNWEYDDDPSALIDFDSISDYFKNPHVLEDETTYITADIARKGRDSTVIRVWKGWVVVRRKEIKVSKVTESADAILELAILFKVPMSRVVVDEDGVGGGVVDILDCEGFVNNSKPINEEGYDNLKSQCSFKMAERIRNKEVREICESQSLRDKITEEMEQVKERDIDKDGKRGIVKKKDIIEAIGRSPDEWDSIMMREIFEFEDEWVFY